MRRYRVSLGLVLALSAVVFATAPMAAASTTPLNVNLVKNPSAELGLASTDGSGVTVPDWETITDSNFAVVKYGILGGPTKAQGAVNGGKKYFWTGRYDLVYNQCDDAIQNIKITGRNSQIDSHQLKVTLSAWVGAMESTDLARVTLTFGDDTNNFISSVRVGIHGPTTKFAHPSVTVKVPAHTRQVTVRLYDAGTSDSCLAFFDKISVELSQA